VQLLCLRCAGPTTIRSASPAHGLIRLGLCWRVPPAAQDEKGLLSMETLKNASITWKDVFEEIPIQVHNSQLVCVLMTQLEPETLTTQADFDRLSLGVAPLLAKNVEFLNECLDDVVQEQQKISYYAR
jgi:translation initiation factor 3 subunit H